VFVLLSVALLVVGFFLIKNAKWNSKGVKAQIFLKYDGEEQRVVGNTVKMNDLTIVAPGYSETYEVKLKLADDGKYTFRLDFSETKDGGLKNYVDVTIKDGNKTVASGTLAELLRSGTVNHETDVKNGKATLTFVYTMKETYLDGDGNAQEVTDEIAGGTSASFNIKIGIKG
jgi:hypothetical protein